MVNPIKQTKLCDNSEYILYGEEWIKNTLEKVEKKDLPEKFVPVRNSFFQDPWTLLEISGINTETLKADFKYYCHISENTYYWFVPLLLFTCKDNSEKYKENCSKVNEQISDFSFDFNFWKPFVIDHVDELAKDKVTCALLGHSYSSYNLPSDGMSKQTYGTVELDNGDEILGALWLWYNK